MPVLATKLHVPRPRAGLVVRHRLQDVLTNADGDATRLILLCAPAGSGKTTLLCQWLAADAASAQIAWVSLDGGDNDVRRFLTHVIAAVETTNADVGRDAQAVLDAAGDVPVTAVLTSLINDLDTLAGPTVLALDDYHAIDTRAVHEALGFVLDHLPRHVRLAITTRADPPLPLARLRSNGGLVELRAADLRFTADEADALLNDAMGLALDRGQVTTLDDRTEGWAAGLQLAALSLRGRDDVGAFVDDFAGSHRFVLDYLVEEVLNRQPDDVRDFLLDTSVLRALTGSLCEVVTGRPNAAETLEALERDDLFIVPLDDRHEWYRYHHLFADALHARLRSTRPSRLAELHAAAGRWHGAHGSLAEAIAHFSASGDAECTADLIELALPGLRRERLDDTMRGYVRGLPDEVVRRRPLLATFMAWTRLARADLDGVLAWLADAEAGLGRVPPLPDDLRTSRPRDARDYDREVRQLPAMIAVYRASVAQARGDTSGTVAHARRAMELSGPDDHFTRGAAAGFLGLAAWGAGDLTAAVDTFGASAASLRAAGNVADELGATVVLATMWLGRGRPDEARRLCETALAATERYPAPLSTTGDVQVALAEVLREQGDLDAATHRLETARALGDTASLPENRHRWYTAQAGILRARGDLDGALTMLDRAEAAYQRGFFPDLHPISAMRARVLIAQGRLGEAAAWARTAAVAGADPDDYLGEFSRLTLARLLIAQGLAGDRGAGADSVSVSSSPSGPDSDWASPSGPDSDSDWGSRSSPDEAVALLDPVIEAAVTHGRGGSLIEARMVRALAHAAAGRPEAAIADLSAALIDGVPVGYRRLFLDEGAPLENLLRSLVARRPVQQAGRLAARLLGAGARAPAQPRSEAAGQEELSERELEVLRLLATALTGPEIARALYVSVNTLRTHTRHIFTKLNVNTRRAAVDEASRLRLL